MQIEEVIPKYVVERIDEVFEYTGNETIPQETVPKEVRVVHFDCSVVGVEARTFFNCKCLKGGIK